MAILEYLNGDRAGQRLTLPPQKSILGRHPECDVVLDQGAVSRQHAQILFVDGEYVIEDLRSRNGTQVNGQLVLAPQPLHDGDELKICDHTLAFHLDHALKSAAVGAGVQADGAQENHPFEVAEDNAQVSRSSTVMWKIDLASPTDTARLTVNPETKLRALIEITQNLSQATALEQILPKVLDSLFNIFGQADRGFVVLCTPEGRLLPKAFKQRKGKEEEGARMSRTIINEVVKQRHAILSADAASDVRFELSQSIADFRIRSMMCAPLVTGEGNVLGVIQIDTLDQRARFTNDDLDVLASVASQAAFAIDNARMHETQLKQRAIQADLDAARKVQQVLLPSAPPKVEGYQFFDFYEAANEVGGDFYDYVTLRDGRVGVVLADVSGKNVAAALVMAKLSAEVRYCLASEPTAALAVNRMNEAFCNAGWEDRFATFVLVLLDPKTNTVTLVNAGHMPPFIRRGPEKVEELAPEIAGLPLGVTDGITYDSVELALAPGEMITLFTDGISEALNPDNELYTLERLKEQESLAAENAATLGRAILDDVKRHANNREQSDDMCLVVFGRDA
ncbi:MAG TPA: SpoIIE family protein phosphatase [Pirellulales bacterium]|jgi:serine phosphatase RsbU (regulator of sigma subunit)|nr:SpoIIE family protein phosphatase [Pirellulales bacterium]